MTQRSLATTSRASTAEARDVTPLQCTGATVRRLARRITSFYEHRMQDTGLTLAQYSLLQHLSHRPQSLLALARRLEMDRTTLTRSLKPLRAGGWIAEVRGDDARQRLLQLTPAGERVRQKARTSWRAAQLALEKELGADTVGGLHRQLDHALSKLKAALPEEN